MTNIIKVLVVDDNIINRQYFSMSLKKQGFAVQLAEDGFEAVKIAKQSVFDIILMDIRMPGMDGFETTRRIKIIEEHKKTPVIATSAETIIDETQLFDAILLKPISPTQLFETICQFIPSLKNNNVFDENHALKFSYDDKSIMKQLIDMFKKELPVTLNSISNCLSNQHYSECKDLIHKARGSCKTCGAVELEKLFKLLSQQISHQQFSTINNTLAKLQQAADRYQKAVKDI